MNIIKEKRLSLGMHQKTLARKIGVSLSTVKRWEHNETYPNTLNIYKLESVLKIDAREYVKSLIKKTGVK